MKWILLLLLLVLVLGVAALTVKSASGARWATRFWTRRHREPEMRLPAPRCLRCHGTGWLSRDPERTFTFTGEGFENKHTAATICPACGGTGVARQRPDLR